MIGKLRPAECTWPFYPWLSWKERSKKKKKRQGMLLISRWSSGQIAVELIPLAVTTCMGVHIRLKNINSYLRNTWKTLLSRCWEPGSSCVKPEYVLHFMVMSRHAGVCSFSSTNCHSVHPSTCASLRDKLSHNGQTILAQLLPALQLGRARGWG